MNPGLVATAGSAKNESCYCQMPEINPPRAALPCCGITILAFILTGEGLVNAMVNALVVAMVNALVVAMCSGLIAAPRHADLFGAIKRLSVEAGGLSRSHHRFFSG